MFKNCLVLIFMFVISLKKSGLNLCFVPVRSGRGKINSDENSNQDSIYLVDFLSIQVHQQ